MPPERRGGYRYWMASDTLEFTSHGYNGFVFDGEMRRHDFVGHRIDALNAYAVDYLHRYASSGSKAPFFLFISHLDPHHQNDHFRYEGPDGSKRRFADYELPPDLAGTQGDWRENYPDYLGQCNLIDQNVGKLMDTLEETGLMENTVFLYASDHGSHFKTRNSEYKRSCEDACLHVPLIAWGGPFKGRGSVSDLVSLIDLPPTFLELAGVPVPGDYRGTSLIGAALGTETKPRDAVYAQISEAETGRCVRTRSYTYSVKAPVFRPEEAFSDVYVEDKLYDLLKDPAQRVNLVRDPAYRKVRDELRERLKNFMHTACEPEADILPAGEIENPE